MAITCRMNSIGPRSHTVSQAAAKTLLSLLRSGAAHRQIYPHRETTGGHPAVLHSVLRATGANGADTPPTLPRHKTFAHVSAAAASAPTPRVIAAPAPRESFPELERSAVPATRARSASQIHPDCSPPAK